MLWTVNFALAGCLCMLVLATPCCCDPLAGTDPIARPTRPKSFASPDDLRTYLDQLGQYFAVVGRPRFGKRTNYNNKPASRDSSSYQYQYPSQSVVDSNDLYDFLQSYQSQQE